MVCPRLHLTSRGRHPCALEIRSLFLVSPLQIYNLHEAQSTHFDHGPYLKARPVFGAKKLLQDTIFQMGQTCLEARLSKQRQKHAKLPALSPKPAGLRRCSVCPVVPEVAGLQAPPKHLGITPHSPQLTTLWPPAGRRSCQSPRHRWPKPTCTQLCCGPAQLSD